MLNKFAFVAGLIGLLTARDLIVEKVRILRIKKTQEAVMESGKKLVAETFEQSIEWSKKFMKAMEEAEEEDID